MLLQQGPFQNFDVNELEAKLVKRDRMRLRIAFGGAILLHASSALGLTFWEPPEPVAPPGDMVITIDLAPAMMSTAAEQTAGESVESAPQQETPPEEEPEKVEEEVVEEVPEPEPEPEIVQEEIAPTPKAEKAEVALAPKKKKQEEPKKKKPKPQPAAASQAASAASRTRSDVGGTGAKASPSDLANYIGRLRSALERSKRYPSAAGGASGTASLRFTVNRAGQVTGFTLIRSSGNAALDAATRSMIQSASLPPIPDGLPNSITIGVPVNFRVR